MIPLPIDPVLPEIVAGLAAHRAIVVEAPPGAGKTTRVPRALLEATATGVRGDKSGGRGDRPGEILVLQPRRLPARLGAMRVAEELGERVGQTVGYTVRFEEVGGSRTRLRFVTEGILMRRLLTDPELRGIAAVVLDEFHERHVATDLALALIRRLQLGRRPDLQLCVMSATLDAEAIARYLDGCPRVRSEGRRFDVAVEHQTQPDDRPLAVQVAGAVRRAVREGPPGDVLVFLPGAAEIRRCEDALGDLTRAADLTVMVLHGDLPLEAQARVVAPSQRRKIILSTNVAETSVTIDGVVAVVDAGLARVAGHSPWSGLPTLSLAKISQASAIQRAGRAGRTRPGIAYRLYTRHDFEQRRTHETPEIARLDLAEVVLTLRALGVRDVVGFDWLTPPPVASVTVADELLRRLGATDSAGALTDRGRRMLRFPVHPRLARVLVEAEDRGVGDEGAVLAALIGERDVRERGGGHGFGGRPPGHGRPGAVEGGADVIALLESFERARAARFARDAVRSGGLDPRATESAERARKQLAGLLRGRATREPAPASSPRPTTAPPPASLVVPGALTRAALDHELARSALAGFPDRVGRRREVGSRTLLLAAGGTAELGYEPDGDFLIALDAEERAAGGRGPTTMVRLGCSIDPDWLADVEGGDLRATDILELDVATERVVRRSRLTFGALTLDESVRPAEPSPEVSRLLAEGAVARGLDTFDDPGALASLRARLQVLARAYPELGIPVLDDELIRATLAAACEGLRSFSELRAIGLGRRVADTLSPAVRARLAADAPSAVTLPGGRSVPVQYQADQPPWIESRLQDFFGLARSPSVAGGRIPLTLHLLAPNGRAVQVTNDLDSFWRNHYPTLRRELGRRYPRHAWPEDGRTASPPPPRPLRPAAPSGRR